MLTKDRFIKVILLVIAVLLALNILARPMVSLLAPEAEAQQFQTARYEINQNEEQLNCSISQFPGNAGGMLANINRWRSQVKLEPLSETELQSALHSQVTEAGLTVYWIAIMPPSQEDNAILGAIINLSAYTVFIKLTGLPKYLEKEKKTFLNFLNTLEETHAN